MQGGRDIHGSTEGQAVLTLESLHRKAAATTLELRAEIIS